MLKEDYKISVHLTQLISSEQAYQYGIIPIEEDRQGITFKSSDISSMLKQELEIVLGKTVTLIEETEDNIKQYLASNFRRRQQRHSEAFQYSSDFLEKLLATAKHIGSSDIHFEIYEERCRVRLRLDGKLKEYFVIELEQYPIIVNKLKIRAGLDISEKRLPQDGRISIKTELEEFDIRVSSLPTLHGEKMVLRILSKDAEHIELNDLGLNA